MGPMHPGKPFYAFRHSLKGYVVSAILFLGRITICRATTAVSRHIAYRSHARDPLRPQITFADSSGQQHDLSVTPASRNKPIRMSLTFRNPAIKPISLAGWVPYSWYV